MYSLWDLSTDSVVTTLIVICISALAIAWLFAGRRRPVKSSELEQRRLEGREAEDLVAPVAAEPLQEPDFVEYGAETLGDLQDQMPLSSPLDGVGSPVPSLDKPPPSQTLTQPPPPAEAMAEASAVAATDGAESQTAPTPRSAAQASAMSIAAALVRHDKREVKPPAPPKPELPLETAGSGGDDLTAITGIDHKLAKEMNDLGIRYFDQIVEWAPDHAAWIASRLSSPVTSAQRSAWIAEAQALIDQPTPTGRSRAGRAG